VILKMAASIPAPLRSADIARFAVRGAQLEKIEPPIAYWCDYWVLQNIFSRGLHNTDDACKAYAVSLMDKVEKLKADHPDSDAIREDAVAKMYVEAFGLKTFYKADNAIRNKSTNKQTADTFQAAYTFLDLLQIWPPVDPDITSKIRFAKFQAVRILKAIKAGEDPNLTNPLPPDEAKPPALDPNDPEVLAITGGTATGAAPGMSMADFQASAEDASDDGDESAPIPRPQPAQPPRPTSSDGPQALPPYPNEHSSKATQAMPEDDETEGFYDATTKPDVSPLAPSDGGGYFPRAPNGNGETAAPDLPGPPSNIPGERAGLHLPSTPADAPSQPFVRPPPTYREPSPISPPVIAPNAAREFWRSAPPPTVRTPAPPEQLPSSHEVNEEAMTRAQKHARFAISALNFEDVPTAVKELRAALRDLGAG